MPDIRITEEQHAYLDSLRDELSEEFVGEYGYVRFQDALQYLIDTHESGPVEADIEVDDAAADAEDQTETDDGDGDGDDDMDAEERLTAMMNLLETHADKWDEAESEDARYVVSLPDGDEEHVQTKDDVRAVLFQHYQ